MAPSTRSSTFAYGLIDPGPEPVFESILQDSDVDMTLDELESDEMDGDPVCNIRANRLIIAIDFGTTFSSVAYAVLPKGLPPEGIDLQGVKCIGCYPGYEPPRGVHYGQDFRQDVPTELWYDDGTTGSWRQGSSDDMNGSSQESSGNYMDSSSDEEGPDDKDARSQFNDGNEIEASTEESTNETPITSAIRYWGFEVQQKLNEMNAPRDEARPLTRFKLNLVDGSDTEDVQTELRATLKALKRRGIIKKNTDIYLHYLTDLLTHAKEQLLSSNELQEDTVIQFVLCVPAKWPVGACRIMQAALEMAVKEVGLSKNADDEVCNLFMLSEPEAAAECILEEAGSALYVRCIISLWCTLLTRPCRITRQ